MILLRFFAISALCLIMIPAIAHAQLESLQSRIMSGDRSNPDFVRPGLQDGKTYPDTKDSWSPEEWTESRGNAQAVVEGFYRNGLIVEQVMDEKAPVIEVGDNFMKLSSRDMNRVAAYLDAAYGYTKSTGMFYLHYARAKKPFGVYTANGLTLQ